MRTRHAKQLIAVVGLTLAAVVAVVSLATGAEVVRSANTGASAGSALNIAPPIPEEFGEIVEWDPDPDLIRKVEPLTRRAIEATLVRSWHQIDVALRTGDRAGLETLFAGPILDLVAAHETRDRNASSSNGEPGHPASSVTQHSHQALVTFYSLDGSVMSLDVTSELDRRTASGTQRRTDEGYEVVMVLSDGNWRIRQLHRVSITPASAP